jgi:hypothetical protein
MSEYDQETVEREQEMERWKLYKKLSDAALGLFDFYFSILRRTFSCIWFGRAVPYSGISSFNNKRAN